MGGGTIGKGTRITAPNAAGEKNGKALA